MESAVDFEKSVEPEPIDGLIDSRWFASRLGYDDDEDGDEDDNLIPGNVTLGIQS